MKKYIFLLLTALIVTGCKKEPLQDFDYLLSAVEVHTLGKQAIFDKLKLDNKVLLAALPDRKLKVVVLHYRTIDPQGNEVIASGIVTYPSAMPSFDEAGAVLATHFTVGANHQVPSQLLATHESLFALFGYVVVAPDYLGYGTTVDLPHPYHHHEATSQVSVDMLLAAKEYFASLNKHFPRTLRVVGYSEGGYAALSSVRYIEQYYSDWLTVKEVFAGAGAYDLPLTYETLIKSNYSSFPSTVPMMIIGLDYGDSLKLDYTQIFKEPLLSNYKEWIISKKYTNDELTKMIGSTKLSDFLAPEVFDTQNENTQLLLGSLEKNEMTNWRPRCKVTLIHGNKDSVVPYVNSVRARDSFLERGCNVTLITIENKDHLPTGTDFYTKCMLNLIVNSPNSDLLDEIEDALDYDNDDY